MLRRVFSHLSSGSSPSTKRTRKPARGRRIPGWRGGQRASLRLESLEDRRVLATVTLVGNDLVIDDPAGVDDSLTVSVVDIAGTQHVVVSDPVNAPVAGAGVAPVPIPPFPVGSTDVSIPVANINNSIIITTNNGTDTVTLDLSGLPLNLPVSFDGGANDDAFGVVGDGTNTMLHRDAAAGGNAVVEVDALQITLTGVERSELSSGATATLRTPGANDVLQLLNGTSTALPAASPVIEVTGAGISNQTVAFFSQTTAVVDTATANDGTDQITVTGADVAHQVENLTFNIGMGGDQVVLNGAIEVTGTVSIDSVDAAITNNNANVDITAAALDVTAATFGAAAPVAHIDTAVASLTVDTSAANGNIFVSEANDLTALDLNAGAGNVTITAGGAISDADANVDVTATALSVVATAIGTPGQFIGTTIADLTVNTSGANGDVFIVETDNLTGLNVNAGTGDVTITAGGAIADADGNVDVTASGLTVTATAVGAAGQLIGTAVANLTANTSGTNGDQLFREVDDLASINLNAGAGNVTLVAGGSVDDADGNLDITATDLTVAAAALGGAGPLIATSVTGITANTSATNGDQRIRETDDITSLNLNAGAGNVTIVAGGAITDADANVDVIATNLSVTATAFGAAGPLIGTTVAGLLVNTSGTNGDQFIRETDDITDLNLNAGTGNITLVAGGAITDADGDVDVTANALTVAATGFGAAGPLIGTSVSSLLINTSAGNGDQRIMETDDITELNLNAGAGDVTIVAGGAISDSDANVDVTAASLTVTATAFGAGGPLIGTDVASLLVNTSGANGDQLIRETDAITSLNLNAGTGNITLVAGGAITDADGDVDVTADSLNVTATSFGAAGQLIGTAVANLLVNTSAANGNQFIRETDDLASLNLNAGAGNITLVAGGAIADADGDVDVTATALTASSTAFGTGALIGTAVTSLVVNTSTGNGDQRIRETDALTAVNLNAGTGDITLVAGGAITDADGDVDFTSAALTVTATAFGAGALLGTSVTSLTVNTSAANGDQLIRETDDLTSVNLNAGAGNVTIVAGGAISDADGDVDIIASALTVTATAIGANATPIGTSVADLTLNTSATNGNQFVRETDALTAINLNAGTGNVTITAGGSILDADAVTDVIATDFTAAAVDGLGGAAGLMTEVSSINVSSAFAVACDDVHIRNNLLSAGALTIIGASNAGGCDIRVTNVGNTAAAQGITVAGPVTATGAGADVTIISASPLVVNANQTISAAGTVTLSASESVIAGDDLTVVGGATIQSTGGDVVLLAGDNITIGSGSSVTAAAQITIQGDTGNNSGTNIQIAGNGLVDSGTGTFIRGMNQADTFTISLDRLGAGDNVTVDALDGADNILLGLGADQVMNAATLTVNGGSAGQIDTLALDTSNDTAARIFFAGYDTDGTGRFAELEARSGGSAGGTIDANGIDQYNFVASAAVAGNPNVISVRGAQGQPNQINIGTGTRFEINNAIDCIHVLGQELNDVIDLSAVPGTPESLIDGGAGNDDITGTDGRDVIFGDLGADTLRGGLGDDFLFSDHSLDAAGNPVDAGTVDGDILIGGLGTDSAISLGADNVSEVEGDLFVEGATLDVIGWLRARFVLSQAEAEMLIIGNALALNCPSFLLASGTHNAAVTSTGGNP